MQTPELLAPSLCPAPGGEYFVEGETWSLDSCTQCTCHSGRVLCGTEVCPPLLCHNPVRTQDSCCPQCPGTEHSLQWTHTPRASTYCGTTPPTTVATDPTPSGHTPIVVDMPLTKAAMPLHGVATFPV